MKTTTESIASRRWLLAAFAYAALIVYASLFPMTGWTSAGDPWAWLHSPLRVKGLPRADLIVNVLAYVPLGLAIVAGLVRSSARLAAVVAASVIGLGISFGVETAQAYLPSRVSSLSDLVANSVGSLLGGLTALLRGRNSRIGKSLAQVRRDWFAPGRAADIGLIALGVWSLSQLSPLVPSFDVGNLRQAVAPLAGVLTGRRSVNAAQFVEYVFATSALTLLAIQLIKGDRPRWSGMFAFFGLVLLLKIPIVGRQLSLEALAGTLAGLAIAAPFARAQVRTVAWSGSALLVAHVATEALAPGSSARLSTLNWTPFLAHLANPLVGVSAILEAAWSAIALAWFANTLTPERSRAVVGASGGVLVALTVLLLEYKQQFIPGRVGDVTTAVIAAVGWIVAWSLLPAPAPAGPAPAPRAERRRAWRRSWFRRSAGVAGLLILGGAVRWATSRPPSEEKIDKQLLPKLPAPHELTPVTIAGFRTAHPRLPHPSQSEIELLRRANPRYLDERKRFANGGRGAFDACALTELVNPGTQDIDLLARRLLEPKFTWRGHEQGRPLALLYDWLYERWSPQQREALRSKLAEGCHYLIQLIREDRLSPYNVYLYNAPFQALVACSLALYRDDPRGDAIMAFTNDYWKNRVLPVWRQIMGRNGGWHEGGEYVGIGIGQAIYQVPAMWRSATGEDLFRSEPGIRGFLDFLVHRTQPDGSHFRWGDGVSFDRIVPDASALALEFRHAAAYNLRRPRANVPSAWPWGPLTDDSLRNITLPTAEPLTRLFDGIGMLVARNRWAADATYVTFKAGDNFWSHVHLDQGAFTIHRGAPLAIDSGLYGPGYGSDHHMNYTYQTVAHNTITVTDPNDNVPVPAHNEKQKPRPIANDGGQRRIGSGWGVERGPLDRGEWEAKRSIYHAGRIVSSLDDSGLVATLADITPAYTNGLSGEGTFSHRRRRVERAWRFFAYDLIDDYVVVYDDVHATRASFRKRWLLHSIVEPRVADRRFLVSVPPQPGLKRPGGELDGHVLLPRRPMLHAIGGRGFEFFVDGKNYDEDGTLWTRLKNRERDPLRPEPGSWRIELTPEADAQTDQFLVVLVPSAYGATRPHRVRLLVQDSSVGLEVAGPTRTTRWWFTAGRLAARIEIAAQGASSAARSFDLRER